MDQCAKWNSSIDLEHFYTCEHARPSSAGDMFKGDLNLHEIY